MRRIYSQAVFGVLLILLGMCRALPVSASDCPRRCLVRVFADERYSAGMNDLVRAVTAAAQTEYFSFSYWGETEYLISFEFKVFENVVQRPVFETDEQGRRRIVHKGPYRSRLQTALWFVEGRPKDRGPDLVGFDHVFNHFVRSWDSWSAGTDPAGHKADIISGIDAAPPFHEIAWDYEMMPVSIEMEPEKECVEYGERVFIDMKNFKDRNGRDAGPGILQTGCENRFVFTTEHGKILLPEKNKIGEREWGASIVYDHHSYQAPESGECGDCKEDTITVYNSCDVLDSSVHPYSQTRRREKIHEIFIDIACGWQGTIAYSGGLLTKGGESIAGLGLGKGEAEASLTWRLDVVFKLDRENDRVRIFELESAQLSLTDVLEGEALWEGEAGKTTMGGRSEAEVRGRNLSRSECDLELIFDRRKKTYKIEGILDVKDIQEISETEVLVDMPPIRGGEKDTGDQPVDYREEILIQGKYSEDNPEEIKGLRDEIKELPAEFVEFMEAMAGKVSGKMRWRLEKKGRRRP